MTVWKLAILAWTGFAAAAGAAPGEVTRDRSHRADGSEFANARFADFGAPARAGEAAYLRAMNAWYFRGPAAAAPLLERAAAEGSAAAMYRLGAIYVRGDGVARDERRGLGLVRQAAERGYPAAMLALASAFAHGEGVARDERLARQWLDRAAEAGHRPAMEARRRLAER